jgi:cytidylate kinase
VTPSQKIIIAIDGWSSCGKSTLAKELARRLHYRYIDSGAMYRAVTLYLLQHKIDLNNEVAVQNALPAVEIHFERNTATGENEIFLNGKNVARAIREMSVAAAVSEVAAIRAVRHFAVVEQQRLGRYRGIVMDGRDIGTTVFPDAELKVFMTAEPEVRVHRRWQELLPGNPQISVEEVRANLEHRDYIDSHREESPLRRADDALVLDNSDLNREEQVQIVLSWVEQALSKEVEA